MTYIKKLTFFTLRTNGNQVSHSRSQYYIHTVFPIS